MPSDGFRKLFIGSFFIFLDFRVQGIDILPDIIGYILYAIGLGILSYENDRFDKARVVSYFMIFISIFDIYKLVNNQWDSYGYLAPLFLLFDIVFIILNVYFMYNVLMGIKEMALAKNVLDIYDTSINRWHQFIALQIAGACSFVAALIPVINIVYIIALAICSIIFTIAMIILYKKCQYNLN